jgi:two-component system, LytTR family, response regulator
MSEDSLMKHDANGSHELLETGHAAETSETSGAVSKLLVGEREHRLYVLSCENIEYIQSDGNYVKFHANDVAYISRDSVKRLSDVLAGSGFLRIERSVLINIRVISYVQRAGRRSYAFTLNSGARLRSGAKYRDEILRVLPLAPGAGGRPRH